MVEQLYRLVLGGGSRSTTQDFMTSEAARVEYWDFKLEGWAAFRDAKPNATHLAVAELERAGKIELVVTQNIDSLHLVAGTSPEKLVELHGTDSAVECQICHERSDPEAHYQLFARTRKPPVCASCGGLLKPATISFGQQLREADMERAVQGAQAADQVVAQGSTLSVTPAAVIPLLAAERGVPYVIINRGETAHDEHPAVTLRLDAPPYGRSGAADEFMARYRALCYCGAVEYEVRADPVDAKICHCRACQTLHGAPFQWAVIFHKADVRFTRGVDSLYFFNSELNQPGHVLPCKLSCERCRSPIADEGRRMFLAFGPLFDFGTSPQVPAAFQPTCHIFYGSRVIDVDDGKPKFLGHKGSSPLL